MWLKKIPSTRNEISYAENTHKYFPIYKIGVRVVWGWIFYMIPKKRECDKWEKEGCWGRRKFKCTTEFLKLHIFVSVQTKKEIKASTFLKFLIFGQKYFI